MNIRKVRRKCSVRGCKNTDCFAISKVHEVGNSVIICPACLKDGLEAVEEYIPEKKQRKHNEPPSLFYNTVPTAGKDLEIDMSENENLEPKISDDGVVSTETAEQNIAVDEAEKPIWTCPHCGKEYKSEAGFKKHLDIHNSLRDKVNNAKAL